MSDSNRIADNVRLPALWAALLPLAAFNFCYLVAALLEHVPLCIPYVEGCTSASSAGREFPESWIFKVTMLPLVWILFVLWWQAATFVELHGAGRTGAVLMRILGVTAALSLLLYILTLGVTGDDFRGLRRIGINGFALSLFFAQLCFVLAYRRRRPAEMRALLGWLTAICLFVPLASLAGEAAKALGAPRHPVNNAIAWNALWLQSLWFVLLARLMQRHIVRG